MEFSHPNFPQGHPQTPPLHLCSPSSYSLLPNSISTPLQPQSSPTMPCFSLGPPLSPRKTSQLLSTPLQVLRVPFQWHLEPHHKWESWLGCCVSVGYTLLLKGDTLSTCEKPAIKKKLLEIIIIIIITTHLEWYTKQSYLVLIYLLQG